MTGSGFVPIPEWIAPPGQIWICTRCGKTARYRGGDAPGYPASCGWDLGCFIGSALVDEKTLRPVLSELGPKPLKVSPHGVIPARAASVATA